MSPDEVYQVEEKIAQRVAESIDLPERFTDTSNAEKITELFGDKIRFDHRRKRWLIWQGHRWQPDNDGSINRLAIEASRKRYQEATEIEDLTQRTTASKWAIQSESKMRLDASTSIAKSLLPIADDGKNWDSNPMLLSCANGIIDLTTGLLRDGKPKDRITMSTGITYDVQADCPRWKQFVAEIFEDNTDLIHYVQKALGYTLTGSVQEQVVFFGLGSGANGKSVYFSTIKATLGDYAYNAPASLFQRNTQSVATNDIAATEFKRFLMSSEILSSTTINEVRLKKWSGGDPETARFLYSENFEFQPTCKIWLFVNHTPLVEDDSFGFWRRIRLIPFTRKFEGATRDEFLTEKLKTELPGVLNWMIEGCLLWQKEGLEPTPECVKLATNDYQQENDILAEFIADNCDESNDVKTRASMLYMAYTKWAYCQNLKGKDVITKTEFGRRMGDKFTKVRGNTGIYYQGITLKNDENGQISVEFDDKSVPECIVEPLFTKTPLVSTHIDSLGKNTSNYTHPTLNDNDEKAGTLIPGLKIPPELEGLI